MKTNVYLFLTLLLLLCAGCGKDEPGIEPGPDTPDTPVENTSVYIPINWDKADISQLNLATGEVSLSFTGSEIPTFENGLSLIVLQTDTSAYLRRVMNAKVDGNTVVMQTINATMQELFSDTEFTLSVGGDHAQLKSSKGEVYSPTKIINSYEDGTYETIYNHITKSDYKETDATKPISLYNIKKNDFSLGTSLGEHIGITISNEEFEHSCLLTYSAYFKFGPAINKKEITKDLTVPISDIEAFNIHVETTTLYNSQIKVSANRDFNKDWKVKFFPPYKKYFHFFIGEVPVVLSIEITPYFKFSLGIGSGIEATTGYKSKSIANAGISYSKEQMFPTPYYSVTNEEEIYPFDIALQGSYVSALLSINPEISIKLYETAGPKFGLDFYAENKLYSGILIPDMYSWSNELNGGIKFQTELRADFLGFKNVKIFEPFLEYSRLLYKTPKYIKLLEPVQTEVPLNRPIKVKFNVTGESTIPFREQTEHTQRMVPVRFSSNNMKLDKEFILTDKYGNAEVEWTPTEANDSLVATILDYNGKELSRAVFTPKPKEEEFSIVGKWRIRNWAHMDVNPPHKHLPTENYVTFYEDGTYKYIYNPQNEIAYGYRTYTDENNQTHEGYAHMYRYETVEGNYSINQKQLNISYTKHYLKTEEYVHIDVPDYPPYSSNISESLKREDIRWFFGSGVISIHDQNHISLVEKGKENIMDIGGIEHPYELEKIQE